ncbi:MAG: hypothetical protein AAGC47_04465 [Bacteroidota bacterium]
MVNFKILLLTILLTWSSGSPFAQEQQEEREFKRHKIMVVLGHAMTPEGINVDGKRTILFLPTWGLDYDYRFNEKWSIGIHTDIIIENFTFENP